MVSPCYCVVCAVRLQFKILWQGYIKKYEKFKVSPTGTPTDYNPSVFHRELKNIYGIMPLSPTDHTRWYFIESCKKIYGIVPQSPTCTPTDFPTDNTDRFTHIPKPTHVRHVSAAQIPMDWPTSNTNGFTHIPKRIAARIPTDQKVWRYFWTFLVGISINFRRYYWRNLMPPTTINFRR